MTATTAEPTAAQASAPTGPSTSSDSSLSARTVARRRRRAEHGVARTDRVNRAVLLLIGVLLVAAGGWALADVGRQPGSLYGDAASAAADHPDPALAIALGAAAIVVLLSLRWAWSQVSPRSGDGRLSTTTIARGPNGVTTVEPAGAAGALARDLESVDGVESARVRIVSLKPVPDLIATIDVRRDVDLRAVRAALEEPLARFAASISAATIEAELRFRVTATKASRVL